MTKSIKEKLMPLESINSYGYDRVKKQLDIYQKLDDQEYSFNKSLKLHSEQYEEILSRYQSVSEQLNKLMESIDEKKLQEIDSNAEKIDLNKKQLSDLERKLAKIKEQIEQKERGLLEKREKLKQIENLILPENIEEIDDRIFIDIALIFGDKLQIQEESSARNYFEKYKDVTKQIDINKIVFESIKKETDEAKDHFRGVKETFEKSLKAYFSQNIMNEIYQKIDPHDFMKNVDYHLSFNEKDEPQLYIVVNEQIDGEADSYRPEWYFSTAQLNTVAFSSFFGRALSTESLAFRTIFVDDPISHFDDMNILGFSDMIRSIIESMDCQIIMSTHDRKIYNILRRKLDDQYYSSCFINLTENDKIKE